MKRLKKKTEMAMESLREIKDSQGTRLWFESLPEENRRDLYKAIDELKKFYDNLPFILEPKKRKTADKYPI